MITDPKGDDSELIFVRCCSADLGLCCTNRVRDSSPEYNAVTAARKQTHTPAYKTKNWPAYNKALKRRGSLSIWFGLAMIWEAEPTVKRDGQFDYSDARFKNV